MQGAFASPRAERSRADLGAKARVLAASGETKRKPCGVGAVSAAGGPGRHEPYGLAQHLLMALGPSGHPIHLRFPEMPQLQVAVLPKTLLAKSHEKPSLRVSPAVLACAPLDVTGAYAQLKTQPEGLSAEEAEARLKQHGQNVLAKDRRPGLLTLFWRAVRNPLVILLAVLAGVSFATGDPRAAFMMLLMIALSVS